MAGPFIFISQSRIKEGMLDDFKRGLREMAEFVEANEPRVIAFEAYLNDDGTEVTGVQIHPDADSMAFHMQIAFEKIMEFDQYLDTQSVEVYGVPNDAVLGMMKQIADQFGGSGMSLPSGPIPWAGSLAPADPPCVAILHSDSRKTAPRSYRRAGRAFGRFFRKIFVEKRNILRFEYEEPLASLLGSHKDQIVVQRGRYLNLPSSKLGAPRTLASRATSQNGLTKSARSSRRNVGREWRSRRRTTP